MLLKKIRKLIVFCLFSQAVVAFDQQDYEKKYHTKLEQFVILQQQNMDTQMHQIADFFIQFEQPYKNIIKQLHHDIEVIHKELKKSKSKKNINTSLQSLHDQLKTLYSFIKKYRLQYEVAIFHNFVKNHWGVLFQAVAQGKDIVPFLAEFEVEYLDHDNLYELAKQVRKDLQAIETYEYRLHADWVDMKLQNYVLKIELTRLRNAILFHPLYKKTKLKLSSSYPR